MTSVGDLQVMIVDDNRQMRFVLRCMLRALGVYRVLEAEAALDAYALMSKTQIDFLLVDWNMQPVDGLAFTKMVRLSEDSPNPYVPILMITAHTELSRVAAARDVGVTGFLRKPITPRMLLERINAALLDPRPFVRAAGYFGPDRRRGPKPNYAGPYRRAGEPDAQSPKDDAFDLDDMRWSA